MAKVLVTITPTYTGCPAMDVMKRGHREGTAQRRDHRDWK
jgi:metal-sulfur cluster biosynthetic enzyme